MPARSSVKSHSYGAKRRAQAKSKLAAAREGARKASQARASYARANTSSRGFLGVEKKFYDTFLVNSNITSPTDASGGEHDPSATSMISTPPQGDSATERIGKKIGIESVQVKGTVRINAEVNQTAGDNPQTVFVALVLDTQTNGAQLNSEDVFTVAGSATSVLNGAPLRNLEYGSRFRVLRSECFVFEPGNMVYDGTNVETAGVTKKIEWFHRFKDPLVVNFDSGTTASVANVIDNSLHIVAFGSDSSANAPDLSYLARIRFVG